MSPCFRQCCKTILQSLTEVEYNTWLDDVDLRIHVRAASLKTLPALSASGVDFKKDTRTHTRAKALNFTRLNFQKCPF